MYIRLSKYQEYRFILLESKHFLYEILHLQWNLCVFSTKQMYI